MFFDRFEVLCRHKMVSKQKACLDCGLSRTAWNKWKAGAVPNGEALQTLADYFAVTVDYLLNGEENKKAPDLTEKDERIVEEAAKIAFLRGIANKTGVKLSNEEAKELWEDGVDYIAIKFEQRKRQNGK